MASSTLALALLSVMALVLAHQSMAQHAPHDFLRAHNAIRARVRVPPLRWNNTVAAYARNYARRRIGDCRLVKSGGPYGENLFRGPANDSTAADAVNSWARDVSSYAQIVSRQSVWLGCARVRCNSGAIFIICSYSPKGNIPRQSPDDILPEDILPDDILIEPMVA